MRGNPFKTNSYTSKLGRRMAVQMPYEDARAIAAGDPAAVDQMRTAILDRIEQEMRAALVSEDASA